MIGRRLPIGQLPELPGDYMGPTGNYINGVPAVLFLKPNARDPGAPPCARSIQHVTIPPHTIRECADGSLEIRASLGDMHGDVSDGWHGFLDEGHRWRKC
jgi:hypothetical protein